LSAGVVGSEPRANNWRIMSLQVQIAERGGGGGVSVLLGLTISVATVRCQGVRDSCIVVCGAHHVTD
jgi:hypothetical protein